MSHYFTTAASYVLNKYSRSYPSTTSSSGRAPAPAEPEWQHFTNPIMRIVLEAKKSPSGKLVSMRLRIFWSLHTGSDDLHTDQRDVVFEDLELLSFSSFPTLDMHGAQPDQSLPLKAVYRDAVVGIRYLHPRIVPPGAQPTYRRFQITFKDSQDVSQFIDAIKTVCPCKANPQPIHLNRHSTTMSTSLMRTATAIPAPAPMRPARLTEHQRIASVSVDSQRLAPSTPLHHPPDNLPFSVAPSSVATNLSSDDGAFVTCSETSYRSDAQVDHPNNDPPRPSNRDTASSSLPNSSQPSSSDQSVRMPPPPLPRRVACEPADLATGEPSGVVDASGDRSHVISSLSEHPSLYELSRADLEILVGQVIREEGFLQLLETLDSLWQIKGLLGH